MVNVELTDEDVSLFKLFRQYQDQFQVLLKHGMFDPFKGSKTVHKDGQDVKMVETTIFYRF